MEIDYDTAKFVECIMITVESTNIQEITEKHLILFITVSFLMISWQFYGY